MQLNDDGFETARRALLGDAHDLQARMGAAVSGAVAEERHRGAGGLERAGLLGREPLGALWCRERERGQQCEPHDGPPW